VNRIDAEINYSYQGKTRQLRVTIDLDRLMQNQGEIPDLHQYLARHHQIDSYSYEYEVLESHPIEFSNAIGMAQHCLHDVDFDLADFQLRWRQEQELELLAQVAYSHLGIDNLEQNLELKAALLEAFQLGKAAAQA